MMQDNQSGDRARFLHGPNLFASEHHNNKNHFGRHQNQSYPHLNHHHHHVQRVPSTLQTYRNQRFQPYSLGDNLQSSRLRHIHRLQLQQQQSSTMFSAQVSSFQQTNQNVPSQQRAPSASAHPNDETNILANSNDNYQTARRSAAEFCPCAATRPRDQLAANNSEAADNQSHSSNTKAASNQTLNQ